MNLPAIEQAQDRRVRKTRKAIREALETLLQDNAIEQITAKEIAAEADIGYTTFFRHFDSKEAALADLADSEARDLIEDCYPLLRLADSRASCEALCRHVAAKQRVWSALLTGGAAAVVSQALVKHSLARSSDWPTKRFWLPAESGTALIISLTVETLGWWLSHARQMTAPQVAEIMDRLFVGQLVV
jgi:AcrR family transcriptional regulator